MMVEEIDEELKKQGKVDFYYVFQIKEKYGSLRWYDNGSQEIADIIKKYSIISSNVCAVCGKPDTSIRIDGWIWPECRECYEKDKYNHKPYDDVISNDNHLIQTSYTVGRWTDDGYATRAIDISETVEEYRRRWKEWYEYKKIIDQLSEIEEKYIVSNDELITSLEKMKGV